MSGKSLSKEGHTLWGEIQKAQHKFSKEKTVFPVRMQVRAALFCLTELNALIQEDASIRNALKRHGETAQKEAAFILITRFKSRLFPESDMDMKEWLGATDHVHLSAVLIKNVFPKLDQSAFLVPDIQKILEENPDIRALFEKGTPADLIRCARMLINHHKQVLFQGTDRDNVGLEALLVETLLPKVTLAPRPLLNDESAARVKTLIYNRLGILLREQAKGVADFQKKIPDFDLDNDAHLALLSGKIFTSFEKDLFELLKENNVLNAQIKAFDTRKRQEMVEACLKAMLMDLDDDI